MTDHLFLPEKEDLDKLLRYEVMINRELNHAIAELERVQARRKGEAPTPTYSRITKQSQKSFIFNIMSVSISRTRPNL
jgi:hypothetical protein